MTCAPFWLPNTSRNAWILIRYRRLVISLLSCQCFGALGATTKIAASRSRTTRRPRIISYRLTALGFPKPIGISARQNYGNSDNQRFRCVCHQRHHQEKPKVATLAPCASLLKFFRHDSSLCIWICFILCPHSVALHSA